jgi:hypothetical protein
MKVFLITTLIMMTVCKKTFNVTIQKYDIQHNNE